MGNPERTGDRQDDGVVPKQPCERDLACRGAITEPVDRDISDPELAEALASIEPDAAAAITVIGVRIDPARGQFIPGVTECS